MSMIKKIESKEEYIQSGGLPAIAKQQLEMEIQYAVTQKNHPLHNAVEAARNGNIDEADRLILTALINALQDDTSPLQMSALLFVKLPAIRLGISRAVNYTRLGNDAALNDMPLRIIQWASMEIQEFETKQKQLIPIQQNREKATAMRKENAEKSREEFQKLADDIRAEKTMNGIKCKYNNSDIAQMIIDRKSLPQKSHRTIRRAISKNC